MACQHLQGKREWPGDSPGHVRPVCCYASSGAGSPLGAACIMPEIPACNLGRQHDSIMSAASLPFPAGLTGCEARAERLVTCRCCQLCRGQWTSDVTAWTSLPLRTAVHTTWRLGKRWLMPLSWSCSAGASTPRCWRRLRIGRCQRMCPSTWRPSALMMASHQTGGLHHMMLPGRRFPRLPRLSQGSSHCKGL